MLGKLPYRHDQRSLRFADYLAESFPAPPPEKNWSSNVSAWPMFGNDRIGDCVIEGTVVDAPDALVGYRARYNGPVVSLEFASGKKLTVTPNHAVLTPRGFLRAGALQEGDDAIGASRAEPLGRVIHFDQSPSPVEQVVASLGRSGTGPAETSRRSEMVRPVDFHGDGRFMDSYVDVVGTGRFLQCEGDAPLRQPHGDDQIVSASQLEGLLHRESSAFQAGRRRGTAAFGDVRVGSQSGTFGVRHAGVPHAYRMGHGSDRVAGLNHQLAETAPTHPSLSSEGVVGLAGSVAVKERHKVRGFVPASQGSGSTTGAGLVASGGYPSSDGRPTDPHFAGDLFKRYPSLVETDRLVNVNRGWYSGHVYDLSTESQWYASNGIIVHNCTCASAGHLIELWTAAGRHAEATIDDTEIVAAYSAVAGYDPSTGANDNGAEIVSVLKYWQQTGVAGHRIGAYVELDPANHEHVMAAINLFGGVDIGLQLPAAAQGFTAPQWPNPPTPAVGDWQPGTWGGHCVPCIDYTPDGPTCVTWGELTVMTWGWWDTYVDECWAIVAPDFLDAAGVTPEGFNLEALNADLAALHA